MRSMRRLLTISWSISNSFQYAAPFSSIGILTRYDSSDSGDVRRSPRDAGSPGEGLEGVGGLGFPKRQDQSDRERASVRHSRGRRFYYPFHRVSIDCA